MAVVGTHVSTGVIAPLAALRWKRGTTIMNSDALAMVLGMPMLDPHMSPSNQSEKEGSSEIVDAVKMYIT